MEDPNKLVLSLCTLLRSGVYALHSPSPQQEGNDHVLPSVLLFTGPSHNPVSLASQSPVSQVFLLFPLLQRRKLRLPEVNGPAQGHTLIRGRLRLGPRKGVQGSRCLLPLEEQSLWGSRELSEAPHANLIGLQARIHQCH